MVTPRVPGTVRCATELMQCRSDLSQMFGAAVPFAIYQDVTHTKAVNHGYDMTSLRYEYDIR